MSTNRWRSEWLDGRADAVEHLRRAIAESSPPRSMQAPAVEAHFQMALAHLDQARAALRLAAIEAARDQGDHG